MADLGFEVSPTPPEMRLTPLSSAGIMSPRALPKTDRGGATTGSDAGSLFGSLSPSTLYDSATKAAKGYIVSTATAEAVPAIKGMMKDPAVRREIFEAAREMMSGPEAKDLIKQMMSGPEAKDLIKQMMSGPEAKDLIKQLMSGPEAKDLIKQVMSGSETKDLIKQMMSGPEAKELIKEMMTSSDFQGMAKDLMLGMAKSPELKVVAKDLMLEMAKTPELKGITTELMAEMAKSPELKQLARSVMSDMYSDPTFKQFALSMGQNLIQEALKDRGTRQMMTAFAANAAQEIIGPMLSSLANPQTLQYLMSSVMPSLMQSLPGGLGSILSRFLGGGFNQMGVPNYNAWRNGGGNAMDPMGNLMSQPGGFGGNSFGGGSQLSRLMSQSFNQPVSPPSYYQNSQPGAFSVAAYANSENAIPIANPFG